jgi:hypothetical protein
MKLQELIETIVGKNSVRHDDLEKAWVVYDDTTDKILAKFHYHNRDEDDKLKEKKAALKYARDNK